MLKRIVGTRRPPDPPPLLSPSVAEIVERDAQDFRRIMREIERKVMARRMTSTDELDLPSHRSA